MEHRSIPSRTSYEHNPRCFQHRQVLPDPTLHKLALFRQPTASGSERLDPFVNQSMCRSLFWRQGFVVLLETSPLQAQTPRLDTQILPSSSSRLCTKYCNKSLVFDASCLDKLLEHLTVFIKNYASKQLLIYYFIFRAHSNNNCQIFVNLMTCCSCHVIRKLGNFAFISKTKSIMPCFYRPGYPPKGFP